uniref:Uncharacterized protein n=1 Tax=Kalanchoe fedtschenkoi TaxID=63787 RepID=A0A7N0TJM5_KALFE
MGSLGGGMGRLFWWNGLSRRAPRRSDSDQQRRSKSSGSTGGTSSSATYRFPINQAVAAGGLALTGDTIAQVNQRWRKRESGNVDKDVAQTLLSDHDWLRSLRMLSYGFLLYGPGSYAWYQLLDRVMPQQTAKNLLLKVFLNQVVLGPSVIAVVFAWNNLWLGKLKELPKKYQNDALPTLLLGFRFWIPVSILNFWVVPLPARVAFMSTGSIFWNFCLSSTMSK